MIQSYIQIGIVNNDCKLSTSTIFDSPDQICQATCNGAYKHCSHTTCKQANFNNNNNFNILILNIKINNLINLLKFNQMKI